MKYLLPVLILVAPAAHAFPADDVQQIEDAHLACIEKSKTEVTRLGCVSLARHQMDEVLAEVYAELRKYVEKLGTKDPKFGNEAMRRFEAQQAMWPKYREVVCRFDSLRPKGEDAYAFENCLMQETKTRIGRIVPLKAK